MNILNRIIAILLFLALLLGIILVAVYPLSILEGLRDSMDWSIATLQQTEDQSRALYILGRVVVVILSAIVFGGLTLLEVRRPGVRTVPLTTQTGGKVHLTTDSVARRLAWHIDQLPEVVSVTPRVSGRGGVVDVKLDLETSPEIVVPVKTDEVINLSHKIIEQDMGLKAGKIEVRIRHAPYPEVQPTLSIPGSPQ
ncbi:MAG: hypothetical protein IT330_06545 [Anaerolineae bacterium]|nr:hypothetical protein [Anaerolineae bacterium]